jgi:hypothetical protein
VVAEQLIGSLALALLCCASVALGACGQGHERPSPALRPVRIGALPAPVRRDMSRLRADLGGPGLRVRAYRSTRRKAIARLDAEAPQPAGDGHVSVVTFAGAVAYRHARTPPGEPAVARGRFAWATYAADDGEPLDFGVLPTAPAGLR